jgi:hypothetical protein
MLQLVPFQRSANGWLGKSLNPAPPTAVHALAEVHDTPRRYPTGTPDGNGTGLTVQLVPFQTCDKGRCSPRESMKNPTAMHEVEDEHETEKPWPLGPWGEGTD